MCVQYTGCNCFMEHGRWPLWGCRVYSCVIWVINIFFSSRPLRVLVILRNVKGHPRPRTPYPIVQKASSSCSCFNAERPFCRQLYKNKHN